MTTAYVERRPAGFYVAGSRVPIDCIVRDYWSGEDAESIRQNYPTLSLEQVFGALAFYLANRADVDTVIAERERIEDNIAQAHAIPRELKERLVRSHLSHTE